MFENVTVSGMPFVARAPRELSTKEYKVEATVQGTATIYVEADSPEEALIRAQRVAASLYEEDWALQDPAIEAHTLEEVVR